MLQRLTDGLKADPARTLHVIYVTLMVTLAVVLFWMHHVHVRESAELRAQVELANQEALKVAHDDQVAAAEQAKRTAVGAAQAASTAAAGHINDSARLKATQALQAEKVKAVANWEELNRMAGVK